MSLAAKLAEKAADLVDDKAEGWADKLIAEGRDLANEHGDTLDGGKDAAHDALDLFEANKQPFLRLGKVGLGHLLAMWQDDKKADARRHYLATEATYAERRDAMQKAGDAASKDADESEAAWDAAQETLKQVGMIGLKFLVKLVLGSMGVPGLG